jgi:Ser-tRNA(Ala) deacylase AlaX
MPTDLLYATDAYLRSFEARIAEADPAGHRVALDRSAFYPGGGGQPHDLGELVWDGGRASVRKVTREGPWVSASAPRSASTRRSSGHARSWSSSSTAPRPTPIRR